MRGTRTSTAAVLLALALVACGGSAARAAQGELDTSYGAGGFARLSSAAAYGGGIVVAPDGSAYGVVSSEGSEPGVTCTRTSADGVVESAGRLLSDARYAVVGGRTTRLRLVR